MAKKSAVGPVLVGVGVIGAGAAFFLTQKKAKKPAVRPKPSRPPRPAPTPVQTAPTPVQPTPVTPTITPRLPPAPPPPPPRPPARPRPKATPPTSKPPPGTRNKTIGEPYRPGRANEKRNAVIACNRNPKKHPNGKVRGTRPQDVWLADVAYWETNDSGPLLIDPKKHRKYAQSWTRIYNYVKECIAKKRAAEEAKRRPKPKTEPPKPPPPPKPEAPKGPKIPDLAAERRNADYAVRHEPKTSNRPKPYDRQKGTSEKSHLTWLTNWAYWQTYPTGPTRITKEPKDRVFAKAWLRIRDLVNEGWAQKKAAALPPPPPPPPPAPPPEKRSPAPAPVAPPPPKLSTSKSDLAAAAERRNAALVVTTRPTEYPRLSKKYRGGKGYKLENWLTNVAYWSTYPEGPTRLDPKDATHKPYIAAWVRIRNYVRGMLALHKKLPKESPLGVSNAEANRNWIAWALAMWASSDLRTAPALADAYTKATRYLATTEAGKRLVRRDVGSKAGPLTVTASGLTAAGAIRVPTGELTAVANWRNNPSRAFWTTTTIY